MQPETVRAAWVWCTAGLVWCALPDIPSVAVCVDPVEVEAVGPHTVAVRCRSHGEGLGLRGPARRLFGRGVDANCSDSATLETLSGIGPARAQAIVAEREEAPYSSAEDLQRVHGIGPKTVEKLRSELVFGARRADRPSVPFAGCRSTVRGRAESRRASPGGLH